VYDFKLHELRHTAASLAIQAGANIKALQNMLGHESAGLTLDRYGHLYGSDVEAVGVAINDLLTRNCGQNVGTGMALPRRRSFKPRKIRSTSWNLSSSTQQTTQTDTGRSCANRCGHRRRRD
jgi:hypothetical protein